MVRNELACKQHSELQAVGLMGCTVKGLTISGWCSRNHEYTIAGTESDKWTDRSGRTLNHSIADLSHSRNAVLCAVDACMNRCALPGRCMYNDLCIGMHPAWAAVWTNGNVDIQ